MNLRTLTALTVGALTLAACGVVPKPPVMAPEAVYTNRTATQLALNDLPPPQAPVAVAVYSFPDQTGQFKPTDTGQTLSRALSQGGAPIMIRALQDAGNRKWFTIVEREQFKDLLNERQIILEMRQRYLGETQVNPQALPALLFAGVLIEGGVVGYDTNTQTGGVGATMLGIGANGKYRQDTVTVYLRAVSVKTGEVLTSVTTSKTITSYAVDVNVFRYVASDKLLETENGFTTNEPAQLALREAIEKAVYGLVMEGADLKLWNFADPAAAAPLVERYHDERDGRLTARQVELYNERRHRSLPAQTAQAAPRHGDQLATTHSPPPLARTGEPPAPTAPATDR